MLYRQKCIVLRLVLDNRYLSNSERVGLLTRPGSPIVAAVRGRVKSTNEPDTAEPRTKTTVRRAEAILPKTVPKVECERVSTIGK